MRLRGVAEQENIKLYGKSSGKEQQDARILRKKSPLSLAGKHPDFQVTLCL